MCILFNRFFGYTEEVDDDVGVVGWLWILENFSDEYIWRGGFFFVVVVVGGMVGSLNFRKMFE